MSIYLSSQEHSTKRKLPRAFFFAPEFPAVSSLQFMRKCPLVGTKIHRKAAPPRKTHGSERSKLIAAYSPENRVIGLLIEVVIQKKPSDTVLLTVLKVF